METIYYHIDYASFKAAHSVALSLKFGWCVKKNDIRWVLTKEVNIDD